MPFEAILLSLSMAQGPTLADVLARTAVYVTDLHKNLALIVANEDYQQVRRGYGVSSPDLPAGYEASGVVRRQVRSEFALLAVPDGKTWLWYRDAYEVDGKTLHDRTDRLQRLFMQTPATAAAQAQLLDQESARHNVGVIRRTFNVPIIALMFLTAETQAGFAFEKRGEKDFAGVKAWIVSYRETRRPTLVSTAKGEALPTRGEIWLDPENGRVLRTVMIIDVLDAFPDMKQRPERYSAFPRIQIEVRFAEQQALKMWMPVEMKELYDRGVEIVSCVAKYSGFRRYEPKIDTTYTEKKR